MFIIYKQSNDWKHNVFRNLPCEFLTIIDSLIGVLTLGFYAGDMSWRLMNWFMDRDYARYKYTHKGEL